MKNLLFFTILFLTTHLSFGQWTQHGSDIDGEAAGDESGYSVSLSSDGSRMAIGAHFNNGNGLASGHVRIYQWDGASWQFEQDIDGEALGDYSGVCVSLNNDGTTLAIGAIGNDGNTGDLSDNRGHVRIYEFDGVSWVLQQEIDGEAAGDQSGSSVSLSSDGSILAIGVALNDGVNGNNSGHVRIYEFDGVSWILQQEIDGEAAGDWFGSSVSLSSDGSILAIGAALNDGVNGNNSGHVRIYEFDGVSWILQQEIDGEAADDRFGQSVSLSSDGTIVAIGASSNDGNGNASGHVRIYQWDGVSWILQQEIDGEAGGDQSGNAVSLSDDGSIVAIGAFSSDSNGVLSGHVHIYGFDGISWDQLGEGLDGEAAGDWFGHSVSLSDDGSIVAIGARYNDGNGNNSGHVRTYKFRLWEQVNQTIDQVVADDHLGSSISLSGNGAILAVGATEDDLSGTDPGYVQLYEFNGVSWTLQQKIDGEAAGDRFGSSVSLSSDGTTLAIGALTNDGVNGSDSGHVQIYRFDGVSWILQQEIDGEAMNDFFGSSVSLSSDGSILAIGAINNDGNTGNPIDNRGHVQLYELNGVSWQLQQEINGDNAGDWFGQSVSLSDDGNRLAVGAINNSDNGISSGQVKIYEFDGVNWNQLGLEINGEDVLDQFGFSVSLNADGSRVAIGATELSFNDVGEIIYDSNEPGYVRVYQWDGISWGLLQDIEGEAAGDWFGYSVSLSDDGNKLAVGATRNDHNGANSGHVRLYDFNEMDYVQVGQDINGEAASDQSGWSVSLSADGSIVAIGAPYNDSDGNNSGAFRVFFNPELETNAFIGLESGFSNLTGAKNSFMGRSSGFTNTHGSNNSFTGYQSGYSNITGNYNTANGTNALSTNSTGNNNVAIGNGALHNNLTGSNNTAIGNNARTLWNNAFNSTAIGNGALAFGSNQIRIGNSSVVSIGGYEPWSHLSDGRFKTNIKEDISGIEFIEKLRPVSYEIDQSKLQAFLGEENSTTPTNKKAIGFIAQEVEQVVNENNYAFTGVESPQNEQDHYSIRYSEFVVPLVKAIQEQQQFMETNEQLIESLEEQIKILKNKASGTIDTSSSTSIIGLKSTKAVSKGFLLEQIPPHSFDKTISVMAELPATVNEAKIVIYNLNGVELQSYLLYERGRTSVEIKGGSLQSGMYLYALLADGQIIDTKMMILTK